MSKILVLGSNSFSGSFFARYLLSKEHDLVLVSRSEQKNKIYLPYTWKKSKNIKFFQYDINSDLDSIISLVNNNNIKFIVNFSAQSMVAQSWENPEDWMRTNVLSFSKLINKLSKIDFIEKFIHITTPEVYGNCEGLVYEDKIKDPSTPYAISRAASDMIVDSYFKFFNFPFIGTRASNVYGEGQQLYRIIPKTIIKILKKQKLDLHGGGISDRNFIYMGDVCSATYLLMQKGNLGEYYHISGDNVIKIKDLVAKICDMMNVKFEDSVNIIDERIGKDLSYKLDNTKIKSLGWKNLVKLENGLIETIRWVKNNYEFLKGEEDNYIHKK